MNARQETAAAIVANHDMEDGMTLKTGRAMWALAFLGMLCSPTAAVAKDVEAFISKDADFSSYHSYKWERNATLTRHGVVENEPTVGPMVRKAVDANLAKKGLIENSESPDLVLRVIALNSPSPQLEALIFSAGPNVNWTTNPIGAVGRYNRGGTLVVNVVDAKTEKSVWLGIVVKALGKPDKLEKDVMNAANKLFKKFPDRN